MDFLFILNILNPLSATCTHMAMVPFTQATFQVQHNCRSLTLSHKHSSIVNLSLAGEGTSEAPPIIGLILSRSCLTTHCHYDLMGAMSPPYMRNTISLQMSTASHYYIMHVPFSVMLSSVEVRDVIYLSNLEHWMNGKERVDLIKMHTYMKFSNN